MLAYYLHNLDPVIFRIYDNVGPRWYGLAYVLAFVCSYVLLRVLAKTGYADLPVEKVGDFITGCALFGVIIGGRLGYVFFYKPEMLREPLSILRVWEGGMSSHGGMLGLLAFTFYYAHRAVAACASIDPSLTTPDAVIASVHSHPEVAAALRSILSPRHPSQIYEAFFEGIVLFGILWFVRTRTRQPNGVLTGLFFICYAIFRIVIENFREPDAELIGSFTRGQFFSFFLVAVGAAFIAA